jgi:hypothetical protein
MTAPEAAFVLAGGAIVLGLLLLARHLWRPAPEQEAERLFRDNVELCRGPHEFRVVSEDAFPDLDLRLYLQVRRELSDLGFRHAGSYENLTVSRVRPELRSLCDTFLHAEFLIGASTYCAAGQHITSFVSLLDDGRMLLTGNAGVGLDPPPQEMQELLPLGTPITDVYARHRERLTALRAAEPEARFYVPTTIEEIVAVARRHSGVVSAFRRARGCFTKPEFMALARTPQERRNARRLWRRLRPLRDAALEHYFMDQR